LIGYGVRVYGVECHSICAPLCLSEIFRKFEKLISYRQDIGLFSKK